MKDEVFCLQETGPQRCKGFKKYYWQLEFGEIIKNGEKYG